MSPKASVGRAIPIWVVARRINMESIYYSISWACHRKCVHCYEDRFRPYVRDELKAVVEETRPFFRVLSRISPNE